MKKVVGLLLLIFVLASVTSVFASQPDEKQLEVLKKYGIMTGDPDGNLRLDDTITRAEAAKMIVTAQNYASASTRTFEKSEFPDVWDTHWAKDYINIAKKRNIVEGDEHGNFNPEADITNEELVKLLVNILGYEPMAEDAGGYPAGYLITGAKIGLTNGLSFVIGEAATRGDAAIMLANALEIPLMALVRWSTAAEEKYVIFNGEDTAERITVLSRYWDITEKSETISE